MTFTKGKEKKAVKAVLYGPEGIGKSTLASMFPNPVFIDTEGSTSALDVVRCYPENWGQIIHAVEDLAKPQEFTVHTVVIDTADWAEAAAIEYVCTANAKKGIEDFGYGKGYTYLQEEFKKLLGACDKLIAAGINVVFTAHAKMRKQELPDEMGAFDRWELKLTKQVAPMLKEWADMLLFLNYKTYVTTTAEGTKKAQGGKRVMYGSHHPCWDAKNRFGLPDEMEMSYSAIAHIFEDVFTMPPMAEEAPAKKTRKKAEKPAVPPEPQPDQVDANRAALLTRIKVMMEKSQVNQEEVEKAVASRGKFPDTKLVDYPTDFIESWLIPFWDNIISVIMTDRELPF